MKYDISYNSQRDNITFGGTFSGYSQCFSTSAWMFMSYYSLQIDALNDIELSKYLDDVEVTVGSTPGIAEEIQKQDHSIIGKTSLYWEVQRAGITKWLNNVGVKGKAICNYTASLSQAREILKQGPVIIGTNKLGNLPGGHIILGIGFDDIHIICHDPFGNANKNYLNTNGKEVYYEDSFLVKYFSNKLLYWRN
jgi:hypothetical protein